MDYMVCTIVEPHKKFPVFKPGKCTMNQHQQTALFGHDAKNMKQFALHLQSIAQNDTLDGTWFGEVWFPVDRSE